MVLAQLLAAPASPPGVPALRRYLPASPFWPPTLLFLAAATISTVAAHYHTVALREYREVVLEPLLFYWLILQRLDGAAGARRLALATIGAGTYVAALGALQIRFRASDMAIADHIEAASKRLVAAVYPSENNLALLLDRAIPMALALAMVPGWLLLRGTLQARTRRVGAEGATGLGATGTVGDALACPRHRRCAGRAAGGERPYGLHPLSHRLARRPAGDRRLPGGAVGASGSGSVLPSWRWRRRRRCLRHWWLDIR